MERRSNDHYNVTSLDRSHSLGVFGNTLKEIRAEIDRSNERAVSKGYKAESWMITHEETYTYYDDNGMFMKKETIETKIEIYPVM